MKKQRQSKLISVFGVFSFLFIVTVGGFVAHKVLQQVQRETEGHFEDKVAILIEDFAQHHTGFEQALNNSRAFFASSEEVTREEFYEYLNVSGIHKTFPSAYSFSFIERVEANALDAFLQEMRTDGGFDLTPGIPAEEYWPLIYAHPEETYGSLIGRDQRADALRRANIEHARDGGILAVSSPISLQPENSLGVVLALPLYRGVAIPENEQDRKNLFSGALTIGLRLESFFRYRYSADTFPEHLNLSVRDISGPDLVVLFAIDKRQPASRLNSFFYAHAARRQTYEFADKKWEFVFEADPGFGMHQNEMFLPIFVFVLALAVAVIIFGVLLYLGRRQNVTDLKKERDLLREKYDFISTISHQLRTPVTAVAWGVQLLETRSKKQQSLINDIRQKSNNLSGIIDSLLYFIETSGSYEPKNIRAVAITVLCADVVKKLRPASKGKKVSLRLQGGENDLVRVDAAAIERSISVLVDNAITYSKSGGRVEVAVTADKDTVTVTVKDEGIGIPAQDAPNVLNKIFRASNASLGKNEGSGVNLFVTKEVVERHGGNISFQSQEDLGSSFTISLKRTSFHVES